MLTTFRAGISHQISWRSIASRCLTERVPYIAPSDMPKPFGCSDLKLEKRNEAAKPEADERGGRGVLEASAIVDSERTAALRFGRGGAHGD